MRSMSLIGQRGVLALALALAVGAGPGVGLAGAPTRATDQVLDAPLSVLQKPENLDVIGRDVTFRFAAEPGRTPLEGRMRSHRKVRNSNDAQRDCEEALVKTLEAMAKLARKRGGHAVVELRSFWDGYPTSSTETYKCGRGASVTGVSLIGVLEGAQ
jgi:hypothetical protein